MKYEELIVLAIEMIQQFDPITLTPDSHSDQFILKYQKKLEDTERVFLKQIFYGTFRYAEFLKILTAALFKDKPGQTNRQDSTMYHIFTYITCFRLNELPFNEFKKFVYSQDAVRMNVFLSFLFDFEKINTLVRDQWIEIYDISFIDNQIIGGLEDRIPQMTEILGTLSERATGKKSELVQSLQKTYNSDQNQDEAKNEVKKPTTVPKPFNLTQPKPKKIPEPMVIPKQVEVKPMPKSLNKTSLQQIEAEKKQRREQIKEQILKKAESQPGFELESLKRPTNKEKIIKEVEDARQKELQFDRKYYKPVPEQKEEAEVKLNIAAVLREEKKIREQQEKEQKRLKDLEYNMRDSSEFQNWKDEVSYKDRMDRMEHLQRKKIEMELTREAAINAFNDHIQENKELVLAMKEIAELNEQEKKQKEQEDFEKRHQLIEYVLETHQNAAIEKQKMFEKKQREAEQAKREMEILFEKKKDQDEQERKKREQIMREIYELDRQDKKKVCDLDKNTTMGFGLLSEMSLNELEAKLEQVKREQKEEEDRIRRENLVRKDEQLGSLQKKVQMIKDQRHSLQEQKQFEREDKKRKEQDEKRQIQDIREKSLLEVHSKIESKKKQKKKEEDRLQKELREIKLKRQYLNANAAIVEEKAWISQQEGAQREIKERQISKLVDQEKTESIKFKDRKILAETAKSTVQRKISLNRDYDSRMEKANKENEVLQRTLREYKQAMHEQQRNFEISQKQNTIERDPYKQAINNMHVTQANNNKLGRTTSAKHSKGSLIDLPGQNYDKNNSAIQN